MPGEDRDNREHRDIHDLLVTRLRIINECVCWKRQKRKRKKHATASNYFQHIRSLTCPDNCMPLDYYLSFCSCERHGVDTLVSAFLICTIPRHWVLLKNLLVRLGIERIRKTFPIFSFSFLLARYFHPSFLWPASIRRRSIEG